MLTNSMKCSRWFLLFAAMAVCLGVPVKAQTSDDPSGAFFSAYQEYQRAERLEREGRHADAVAKFRFVATQLGQLKSQNPDWQPLVVDFRLRKTQEAIVRLEGALDSPTLGPPPDLAVSSEEPALPPVHTSRRREGGAVVPPTISISLGGEKNENAPPTRHERHETEAGAGDAKLKQQLTFEKQRVAKLEEQLKRGEAEMLSVSMELEKTKVAVVDLNTQLRQAKEGGAILAPSASEEEMRKLHEKVKQLEEAAATAAAEKEQLARRVEGSQKQIEDLTPKTESASAKQEAEAAKARVGDLETERDNARKETEKMRGEVQTLTVRVAELEGERTQLVEARDQAQKEATEAKTALEKNAELIEANHRLEEKLAEASEKITGMETDAAAKAKVVTDLQADLDKVRGELAETQVKLKDDRERFDKLQAVNAQLLKEYDEVTGALAAVKLGDVTAAEAKLLQQENEILRGIIMRQIKEQARREQAYRLAQEEVERLEIRSDTLNDRINELAKPTLELTEAEQEMLKRPVVTLLDSDAAHLSAKVEVLKPKVDDLNATPTSETSVVGSASSGDVGAVETPAAGTPTPIALPEISPELKALLTQARDAFVGGNFAAAEKLYQQVVEQQPENVLALANLGVSQFRQGKLTAAQLALERAIKVSPKDAFSLTTLGAVMIEQNRIEDAVTYLERANQSAPDDPITLNYLGVASSQLGQFGKAEQSLRRAITVKPDYAEAHFNLAVIYATAKPPSTALAKRQYEKALELGARPDKRLAAMLQNAPNG